MIGTNRNHLLLLVAWISIQCLVKAREVSNRETEASAAFDMLTSTRDALDRDMQKWWQEYTIKLNNYRSIKNESLCNNPEKLSTALEDIETNIERVRYGWYSKMEQLQKITDILHDEKYKNVTGLHKAIGHYIEKANKTATEEDISLKEEEAEVASEKQFLDGRVCDCIWNDWGSWGQCSKTCDEGTKSRKRTVARQAVNGGQTCNEGVNGFTEKSCLVVYCPIDCTWAEWTIWSECSHPWNDGILKRTRKVKSQAKHNGTCEGQSQEAKPCNNKKALEQALATQKQINAHQNQTIADQKKTLGDKDQTIAGHEQTISDQKKTIADQEQTISDQNKTIDDQKKAIEELESKWKDCKLEEAKLQEKLKSQGNWIKGKNGQNCDQVCGAVGKKCNAEEQSSLDTNKKVADAFLQAGYTCKSFHHSEDYPGTPFSTGRSDDDCAPMKTGGKKSVCNGNKYGYHAPLCYCTAH